MKKLIAKVKEKAMRSLFMVVLATSVVMTGCSDDEEEPVVFVIDEEDAAEVVAVVLSVNTYGFSANVVRFSEEVANDLTCNTLEHDEGTISEASADGNITYSYMFDETYSYACDAQGGTVNYSFEAEQTLTTLRYDSDSDISGNWALTDIDNPAPSYNLTGVHEYASDWDAKTDEQPSAFIDYGMDFTDLKVEKATGDLVGGTSQFELTGRRIDGESETYEGTINFSDPEATEVVFSNGGTYVLNMHTGEINQV